MGLFSTPTEPPPPKPSSDGAFEAPNRNARAHCYKARDVFFECLERNLIVDSVKEKDEAQKVCGEEGKVLDRECAKSWVCWTFFYFNKVMMGQRGARTFANGAFLYQFQLRIVYCYGLTVGNQLVGIRWLIDIFDGYLGDLFQTTKSNGA